MKKGSGCMVQKHVAFAPASQKQLGSRLRSPLLRRETMPAQPLSRFFHHTAFANRREPCGVGRRVCLSGAIYADAEKSEWRMALKI
ncbi:MAG: hypothetical protein GTN73_08615 [Candidatus Aminicenantes bacterium]|nr:hypothetical protein [Candidatus Aminicenantes bacterium]